MSRKITAWVPGALMAIVLFMGGLMTAPAASAATGPPPTASDFNVIDICETQNDTFDVPSSPGYNFADASGNTLSIGRHSSGGTATVLVTVYYTVDYQERQYDIQLNYPNSGACPSEAPDQFSVSVGACQMSNALTVATAKYINTDDASDKPRSRIELFWLRVADGVGNSSPLTISNTADGSSVEVKLGANGAGFAPGTWRLDFVDGGTVVKRVTFFVPFTVGCSKEGYPDGDPGVATGQDGIKSADPRGVIRQVGRKAILKVTAINKGVNQKTVFRLQTGSAKAKKFAVVNADKIFKKTMTVKMKVGYKLLAKVKQNGKWQWKVVASGRARPASNGPSGPS